MSEIRGVDGMSRPLEAKDIRGLAGTLSGSVLGYDDSRRRHVVAWMDEVLDALDVDHAPVVAASFGAWMAMQYCLARPQRVARLAMLAPAGIVGLFRIKWLLTNTVKTQISPNTTKAQWMLDSIAMERTRPQLRIDPWRPVAEQFIFGTPNFRRNLREPLPGMRATSHHWRPVAFQYWR